MLAPNARTGLGLALVLAPALWAAPQAAPGPQARPVEGIDEARWAAEGLEAVVREGAAGVSSVRWRRGDGAVDTILLAPPRERVALGRAGADVLVLLAGGVRDSLDVYLARATGEIRRLATDGGRRLPGTFARGLGSWPVAIGDEVFVFAYQKDERCELRAIGFGEQVFASRSLPPTTTGFSVHFDSATSQVALALQGPEPAEPVRFLHPDAPRLHADTGLLEFGSVVVGEHGRGTVRVTNPGAAALSVGLTLVAPGFALAGPARLEVAAGERTELVVLFEPGRAGSYQGALHIGIGELGEPLQLVLRGVAIDPPPKPPPPDPVEATLPPAQPAAPTPGATPVPEPVVVERTRPPAPPPRVASPLTLTLVDGVVEVVGRPGESLWLTSVVMDGERGRPLRPIATWRVRVPGGGGPLRLPVEQLRPPGQSISLLALRRAGADLEESDILHVTASGR